jgi:hypothetical protein
MGTATATSYGRHMLAFHRSRRSDDSSGRNEGRRSRVPALAVETYTGHTHEDYYSDLGFRPPSQ